MTSLYTSFADTPGLAAHNAQMVQFFDYARNEMVIRQFATEKAKVAPPPPPMADNRIEKLLLLCHN